MLGRLPRRVVAATLAAAAMVVPASPALAHYCFKDFKSESAAAQAAETTSWMTAQEFKNLLLNEAQDIPPCVLVEAAEWFDAQPDTRLFKGPGLLAGGTEGTDRTPAGMGYTPIDQFFQACFPA